ncbi:MAG TPA: nickel pincer cofactor biosynthesis protein LarC [Gemmatimonadaceae bacterium]|nr:nickel pincer cofactor biosynthesis protein LarC [Gemmatimonadaceae bacterium]
MTIAILHPFSGISGDMTLGALIANGLDADWLRALPDRLGIPNVVVGIRDVQRAGIACTKVDFEIPPQPHGRHLRQIREMIARSDAPAQVKSKADACFTLITEQEAAIHGTTVEKVHLHEVGAVDAILDVVGSIWGFDLLGVTAVFCGPIATGDGVVTAAHGTMPVPAPATMRLLEGHAVRTGPPGAGELVTPTGAALVRILSSGPEPASYIPRRSGFGAGTKEFSDRANALRIVLADPAVDGDGLEEVHVLTCEVDDMSAEYLSAAADRLRSAGALDVLLQPVVMKKGRAGTRIEVLASASNAAELETAILRSTTSIGVRHAVVRRRALPRRTGTVKVLGYDIAVKVVDVGEGRTRAKPEFDDVQRVALATGRMPHDIFWLASLEAERL